MKLPIDFPPARKALGIAFVAVVAYVIVEGTGVGAAPKQLVSALTAQAKSMVASTSNSDEGKKQKPETQVQTANLGHPPCFRFF